MEYVIRAGSYVASSSKEPATGASGDESSDNPDAPARPVVAKRLAGVDDKAALPGDLPVHPKPVDETFSIGEGNVAAFQRVAEPSASVAAYFQRAMASQGWKKSSEAKGGRALVLLWKKTGRSCRIELVDAGRVTEVWLRSRAAPSK